MKTEKEKTVTLTEKQFNQLIGELSSLKEKVQELTSKTEELESKPPVFFSRGKQDFTKKKELLEEEEKEAILSSPVFQRAIDAAIEDYKRNPPRRV